MSDQITQLENQIAAAVNPREKIDLLNALAWEVRITDPERAISLCEQAIDLESQAEAADQSYRLGKARSYHTLGILKMLSGQYTPALRWLSKALLMYEVIGDRLQIAQVLNSCGNLHVYLNDYPTALDYHQRALEIAQEAGLADIQVASLNTIGLICINLSEWSKALTFLRQSLELAQKQNDRKGQADILAKCASCYFQLESYQDALECSLNSLKLNHEIGSLEGEAEALNNLGLICKGQGDYEQALDYLDRSVLITAEVGHKLDLIRSLRSISDVHTCLEQPAPALSSLKLALTIAQEVQSRQELYYCHQALADYYKKRGDFASALAHYEQYHCIKEAIFSDEADQRLQDLQAIYQSENVPRDDTGYQLENLALQREIKERMLAEESLKLANEKLQGEIVEREQLIADLNAFSHMVAHDLKNPLAALSGYSFLLSTRLEGARDIQTLRYLEIIEQTSQRMNRIIEGLLLLASVREQQVSLQVLDMAHIVSEVEARLEHLSSQYMAQIYKPDTWPTALGYAPWIEEVWANYISNAIKYGGTPPIIDLGADSLEGGICRFWVQDNGAGLSPSDQERLFTAFTRLEHIPIEGHGLGLSIVKRIVERLNGKVSVKSENLPGKGCTFYFTLPAAVIT
jgi:signal transduction histidine kinase